MGKKIGHQAAQNVVQGLHVGHQRLVALGGQRVQIGNALEPGQGLLLPPGKGRHAPAQALLGRKAILPEGGGHVAQDARPQTQAVEPSGLQQPHGKVGGGGKIFGGGGEHLAGEVHHAGPVHRAARRDGGQLVDLGLELVERRFVVRVLPGRSRAGYGSTPDVVQIHSSSSAENSGTAAAPAGAPGVA